MTLRAFLGANASALLRGRMSRKRTYHVGCQSWGYDDWITPAAAEPVFYPTGTKRDEMLGLYSKVFSTIEVDSTLYGLPAESTLRNWYDETPDKFIFSLKFPREITHDHLLRDPSVRVMQEFVEQVSVLDEKLGVMLIQFPASFEATKENARELRKFVAELPQDYKFAMEFRNAGWFVGWTFEELEENGIALAVVEGKWVDREVMFEAAKKVRTDFRYIRVMGERDLERFDRIYRHRDDVLDLWKTQIEEIDATEVFIYLDNYFEGFAPATANKVQMRLGLPVSDPSVIVTQRSLF
jgi:uncharacterized protein YecE (DUF72 family)